MPTLDQYLGCLLGLALGDALGAPFEGGILERTLWRVIGRTKNGEMRWTDDTQMAVDLAESFLAKDGVDPDDLAARFARSYRWSRGYGPAASRVLKRIARGADWREANRAVYADGSFGNGAAMRVPLLGLVYDSRSDELAEATRDSARVTHAHPLGIEGAILVALVTGLAARGCGTGEIYERAIDSCSLAEFTSRLVTAREWSESQRVVARADVVRHLGRGIAAQESCVTAVYLALRFHDQEFLDMQRFIATLGGDVDTIGAMAGAIWGASHGLSGLPGERLSKLEQRERLTNTATALHARQR